MIINSLRVKFYHKKQNWIWGMRKIIGENDYWSFFFSGLSKQLALCIQVRRPWKRSELVGEI